MVYREQFYAQRLTKSGYVLKQFRPLLSIMQLNSVSQCRNPYQSFHMMSIDVIVIKHPHIKRQQIVPLNQTNNILYKILEKFGPQLWFFFPRVLCLYCSMKRMFESFDKLSILKHPKYNFFQSFLNLTRKQAAVVVI